MTLFGSTNLSARSANRDVELGLVMVIPEPSSTKPASEACTALQHQLANEVQNLRAHSREWKGAEGEKNGVEGERKVRWGTKILVWMVGGML
jgi:CDP-diacylglycerol--glycerol-3-phosphate 3-phosphatidyltransferase